MCKIQIPDFRLASPHQRPAEHLEERVPDGEPLRAAQHDVLQDVGDAGGVAGDGAEVAGEGVDAVVGGGEVEVPEKGGIEKTAKCRCVTIF